MLSLAFPHTKCIGLQQVVWPQMCKHDVLVWSGGGPNTVHNTSLCAKTLTGVPGLPRVLPRLRTTYPSGSISALAVVATLLGLKYIQHEHDTTFCAHSTTPTNGSSTFCPMWCSS